MRWHDPATATDLRDYDQVCDHEEQAWAQAQAERAAREEAQREAREERVRREAAERRIAELEAQLRRDER